MGAEIAVEHGYIVAAAERLKGARITTDMVTVTGTENLLMAATLAEGETVLENAAQEPESRRPGRAADRAWARASRATAASRIRIQGVDRLHAPRAAHRVIPDRIESRHLPVRGGGGRRRRAAARTRAPTTWTR